MIWKGKVLVVLIFGVQEEVRRKVGLYYFAMGKVEEEGEHFRVTLTPKASTEWQKKETEKVSPCVRRPGWRVCITNELAKLRRSPRVNGGKARQETVSGPNGMGEKTSGIEQTY